MSTLKQKTISGMAWSVSERLSLQVIQMLISIVLARLLDPGEFGLIGMLAIFTSIAQSLVDSGFGSALIQKKDATQSDSSSIFFFNLCVSIILFILLFLTAPLIARFFNQPQLISITRVLSLGMIINAFSIVQVCMLRRDMDFKTHFIVSIIAVVISGTSGIIAALSGLGVWSLVIQSLSNSFFKAVLLWIFNKWRPIGRISFASLKTMFSFGSKLLVAGLLESVFTNLYQTFIGRSFSAEDLGFYSKAATYETAASVATSMSLGQVIFPAFSPYQDDNQKLKQMHFKTIKMSMFLHVPLMIGLIIIAEPLLLFLLTEKWAASIPYFQLLCLIGLIFPIVVQNYNLFRIKGRSDLHLKLEILKYTLTVIAIALTYRHGIFALIYGQIAVAYTSQVIASYIAGRLINFSLLEQVKTLIAPVILSLIMGVFMFLVGRIGIPSYLLTFLAQIAAGMIVYYLVNKILASPELNELLTILKDLISNLIKAIKGLLWKHR
jgi:teichuronic acid exporter